MQTLYFFTYTNVLYMYIAFLLSKHFYLYVTLRVTACLQCLMNCVDTEEKIMSKM